MDFVILVLYYICYRLIWGQSRIQIKPKDDDINYMAYRKISYLWGRRQIRVT